MQRSLQTDGLNKGWEYFFQANTRTTGALAGARSTKKEGGRIDDIRSLFLIISGILLFPLKIFVQCLYMEVRDQEGLMMRCPKLRGHKPGPDQLLNRALPVLHWKVSDQHPTTAFLPSDISSPFHSQIPLTVVLHSTLSLTFSSYFFRSPFTTSPISCLYLCAVLSTDEPLGKDIDFPCV